MSVSTQQLAEELQIFGLEYEEAPIEKLAELCILYGENEAGMVGELIAFCTSTQKGRLTTETLNSFEHEVLSKRLARSRHSASKDSGHAGARDIISIQELIEAEEEEETLLNAYSTPSKGSQKRAVTTPETPLTKRRVAARSPHQLLSPSSFSPSATPSQKYNSRNNRGEVVTSFGSAQGVSWSGRGGAGVINLKVLGCPESLTGSYKSMFQKLPDIREVLTCKVEELGSELKEHYQIEAFTPVLVPAQVRGVWARSLPRGMCGGPGLQERAFHRWPAALGFRPLVPRDVAGAQAREWTLVQGLRFSLISSTLALESDCPGCNYGRTEHDW